MKKRISIYALITIVVVALFSAIILTQFYSVEKTRTAINTAPTVKAVTLEDIKNDMTKTGKVSIDGDYSDYSMSIDEMKANASMIVLASVAKQEQYSPLSVQSTLSISKTIKGKHFDQVRVFQLGTIDDTSILSPGKKYLLFLGKQTDGEDDTFFIKGGEQGIITIDKKNTMTANDPIIKKDLEKVKNANSEVNALDSLVEIISQYSQ